MSRTSDTASNAKPANGARSLGIFQGFDLLARQAALRKDSEAAEG